MGRSRLLSRGKGIFDFDRPNDKGEMFKKRLCPFTIVLNVRLLVHYGRELKRMLANESGRELVEIRPYRANYLNTGGTVVWRRMAFILNSIFFDLTVTA